MKLVTFEQIKELNVSPVTCVNWVKEAFSIKHESELPPKSSVHPSGIDFFTSMPCLLPVQYNTYCLKLVHRINGSVPALGSDILVYERSSGKLLALIDCDWITAMRTGAVATYAAQLFRKEGNLIYGFTGLGNTARSTLLCLLESEPDIQHTILLHEYKNYADLFEERFSSYSNVVFKRAKSPEEFVRQSDVLFSCITQAEGNLFENTDWFQPGCLVIPVHTRGFQNCDLVFDKVFSDDTGHVKGFKYFNQFRAYAELQDVVSGKVQGRETDRERILSYNVGIALHDALFATKLWGMLCDSASLRTIDLPKQTEKFWI